jgi:hypothetical protein
LRPARSCDRERVGDVGRASDPTLILTFGSAVLVPVIKGYYEIAVGIDRKRLLAASFLA